MVWPCHKDPSSPCPAATDGVGVDDVGPFLEGGTKAAIVEDHFDFTAPCTCNILCPTDQVSQVIKFTLNVHSVM